MCVCVCVTRPDSEAAVTPPCPQSVRLWEKAGPAASPLLIGRGWRKGERLTEALQVNFSFMLTWSHYLIQFQGLHFNAETFDKVWNLKCSNIHSIAILTHYPHEKLIY